MSELHCIACRQIITAVTTTSKLKMNANKKKTKNSEDSTLNAAAQIINEDERSNRANDICGHCLKKCTKTGKSSQALKCDYCSYWFHAECEGINSDQYNRLIELSKIIPNINYYCVFGHCKQVSTQIIKLLGPMVKKVEENTKRIDKIEQNLQNQNNEIANRISEIVKIKTEDITNSLSNLQTKVEKSNEDIINIKDKTNKMEEGVLSSRIADAIKKIALEERTEEDINHITTATVREIEQRKKRKANVIITNLEESESSNAEERNEHDFNIVKKLMTEIAAEAEIKQIFRLGVKTTKPRAIKVRLSTESEQNSIMKRAIILKDRTEYKQVFINRDLTPLEQKERRLLVEEMKKKNLEAEREGKQERWIIRKGRVLQAKLPQ